MLIKGIVDEDFVNYKLPSMYIATATCSFKCDKEYGQPICQNSALAEQPDIDIDPFTLAQRYLDNPITHAVVFGGLEPFDQFDDVYDFITDVRYAGSYDYAQGLPNCDHPKALDPIIIYTGYTREEIKEKYGLGGEYQSPFGYPGIIIKFGRYIPGQQPHYDPVLGVYLASDNQYAERIS